MHHKGRSSLGSCLPCSCPLLPGNQGGLVESTKFISFSLCTGLLSWHEHCLAGTGRHNEAEIAGMLQVKVATALPIHSQLPGLSNALFLRALEAGGQRQPVSSGVWEGWGEKLPAPVLITAATGVERKGMEMLCKYSRLLLSLLTTSSKHLITTSKPQISLSLLLCERMASRKRG